MLFPPFDRAAIATEVDAVSGYDYLICFVPLGLLQSDDVTALCGTESQKVVDEADAVDLFDSCCVDIKSAERELFQPSPCPGGLMLHAGGLPRHLLPRSLFPRKFIIPRLRSHKQDFHEQLVLSKELEIMGTPSRAFSYPRMA